MNIRPPAVAGTFYPGSPARLKAMVDAMMAETRVRTLSAKALIVPHAGYMHSGVVAASAYSLLRPVRQSITRVVLLGPSHRLAFEGISAPSHDAFASPMGPVPLDTEAINRVLSLNLVRSLDEAHDSEHSLEVQLPFLSSCLEGFKLVPLLVGDASHHAVAEIIETLWGREETLIVISTDLSHYLSYEQAGHRDKQTVKAIEQLNDSLTGGQACGCSALNGMLKLARQRGMKAITLDVRSSGDTTGNKKRVVGYGAFVIQ